MLKWGSCSYPLFFIPLALGQCFGLGPDKTEKNAHSNLVTDAGNTETNRDKRQMQCMNEELDSQPIGERGRTAVLLFSSCFLLQSVIVGAVCVLESLVGFRNPSSLQIGQTICVRGCSCVYLTGEEDQSKACCKNGCVC